jgi:glyoxylase-like metal-dependent hydrolase (beta-lactamase superfamily II)
VGRICESVYRVGGAGLSDERDCLIYLVDLGEPVLVDCGVGPGWPRVADNILDAGFAPRELAALVLTHCHVDHAGAAALVRRETGCRVVAHELDRGAIETGDPARTAASWYGLDFPACPVDEPVAGASRVLSFPAGDLTLLHTPGHTPGSMVAVFDNDAGERVLFGQDVHGPFSADFGSDRAAWRRSMADLLALEADVLCEGHYGVFRGRDRVREFIEEQLSMNA